MALIYVGNGKYIGGVPAEDLPNETIKRIAAEWGYSVAETEGILIKGGLYKMIDSDKRPAKLSKPQFPRDSQSMSESEQE